MLTLITLPFKLLAALFRNLTLVLALALVGFALAVPVEALYLTGFYLAAEVLYFFLRKGGL